jgi:CHAT domain-containing protein
VGELRRAFESEQASPYGWITHARGWADAAADAGLAAEAAEAYSRGLGVMSELVSERLTRRFRRAPLRHGQGMAAEAAYWLAREQRFGEAAVALETGRAISATKVVQREAVQTELRRRGHRFLADNYAETVRHLGELERGSPAGTYHLTASAQRQARDLETAQQRYQGLRAEIEALDGFRDAFRPARFADITRAATSRPVVYITAANRGGLALIVSGVEVHAVHLPKLTRAQLAIQIEHYRQGLMWLRQKNKDHAPQWRVCLSDMIAWLSEAIEPLWTALERFGTVTIVPSGPLSLLPLHAAKGSPQPAIAFAPNARIVAAAGQQRAATDPRRVLVAAPTTPDLGADDIDTEIAAVGAHAASVKVLRGADATRDRVLAEFPGWSAYHFTCHGHADDDDPLASGLQLSDGILTAGDILAHRAPGAHLAVLSACDSSVPHADLFDESIGLPAALMEAGMQGVIGSLWQVEPQPARLLVHRFYQRWNDGDHPAIALQRAQDWLRTATNEDILHIDPATAPPGRITGAAARAWRSDRPYDHPDAWAAFTYTGI